MSTIETNIPPSTDAELLTLWSSRKDPRALELIVQRHGGLVFSLSRKMLRDRLDVEDAFQTVFLLLTRHAEQIRSRDSLASWLYSVTVRTCQRIAQMRGQRTPLPDHLPAPPHPELARIEFSETADLLARELDRLPESLRDPLVLVYLEGHSRSHVADLLNTTEDGIKSRLTRGRRLLRTRLLKRGITFSIAFTAVSTTVCEAMVSIPMSHELVSRTLESCQSGELVTASSAPVPPSSLDSIVLVKQGTLMTTTIWQATTFTSAIALLIALGGNGIIHGNNPSTGPESMTFSLEDSRSLSTSDAIAFQVATPIAQAALPDASPSPTTHQILTDSQPASPSSPTVSPWREASTFDEIAQGQPPQFAYEQAKQDVLSVADRPTEEAILEFHQDQVQTPSQPAFQLSPTVSSSLPPHHQSLADVERQRIIKLIDIVSEKQLDLELKRDSLTLSGNADAETIQEFNRTIEIHNKKLDQLRSLYQHVETPEGDQASQLISQPQEELNVTSADSVATGVITHFDPVAQLSRHNDTLIESVRFQPASSNPVSELRLQLTSELPVEILWPEFDGRWQRVDQKSHLELDLHPGDKIQFSIRVNRGKDGLRKGILAIPENIPQSFFEETDHLELHLTSKDVKLLNVNCPVIKAFVIGERTGEFNGIDTKINLEKYAISSSDMNLSEDVLKRLIKGERINLPENYEVTSILHITGQKSFQDISTSLKTENFSPPASDGVPHPISIPERPTPPEVDSKDNVVPLGKE